MRGRKSEIQHLIKVLDSPHDSVDDLAESIWKLIDDMRRQRECWVVLVRQDHLIFAYGIYDTINAARKDLEKYRAITHNNRATVVKLSSPSALWGGEVLDHI